MNKPVSACPDYQAASSSRRCRNYPGHGRCSLPLHAECIDWRRANPGMALPAVPAAPTGAQLTLGDGAAADAAPTHRSGPRRLPVAPAQAADPAEVATLDLPVGLRPEDLAGIAALGVAVCIRSPVLGDLWLVPEYTSAERKEMTFAHAGALARVVHAFPGAQPAEWRRLRADESP